MDGNYRTFNHSNFEGFKTDFNNKIDRNQQLDKQEKLALGREVGTTFNSIASSFSEDYLLYCADKYIEFRQNREITPLSSNQLETDLKPVKQTEIRGEIKNLKLPSESIVLSQKIDSSAKKILAQNQSSIETPKTKFPEKGSTPIEQLKDSLQLNVLPSVSKSGVNNEGKNVHTPEELSFVAKYKKWNVAKKEFIAKNIADPGKALEIVQQGNKYPIIQEGLSAIRGNLEEWDDLAISQNEDGLKTLQKTIEMQLKNLSELSAILSELSQGEGNSEALSALSLACIPADIRTDSVIQSYLNGSADLNLSANKDLIKQDLIQILGMIKEDLPTARSTQELAELRKAAPVTARAIQLQAELHQAIRLGKGWAADQTELTKLGTSSNDVFQLQHPDKASGPAAYFKVGAGKEEAAGSMEKFMWDIALVMGMEERFVPTGETEVRTRSELTGGSEKAMQWDSQGMLQEVEDAKAPKKGGIQVAQEGVVLDAYNGTIPREEVVSCILASLVLGMFDAHAANVFVTEETVAKDAGEEIHVKLKFFDNTRSLPNSNGFINRGDNTLKSTCRCSLLDLPEAEAPLTDEELTKLKEGVHVYKQKMEQLKLYLDSRQGQVQIEKLPPGWMDLRGSMTAMEERIEFMEEALDAGAVETLGDLAIEANPGYKFAYALTLLKEMDENNAPVFDSVHNIVGFYPANEIIQTMSDIGVDLKFIKDMCDDPSLTIEYLTDTLNEHYEEVRNNPPSGVELKQRRIAARQINSELLADSAPDYKDLSRKECNELTERSNLHSLSQLRIGFGVIPSFDPSQVEIAITAALQDMVKNQSPCYLAGKPGDWKVLYFSDFGFQVKDIEMSSPGKITVDGNEMTLMDFKNFIRQKLHIPPTFDELPQLSPDLGNYFANIRGIACSKSLDNESLVITIRIRDDDGNFATDTINFPPGPDGKFLISKEEGLGVDGHFDMEDIINRCKEYVAT